MSQPVGYIGSAGVVLQRKENKRSCAARMKLLLVFLIGLRDSREEETPKTKTAKQRQQYKEILCISLPTLPSTSLFLGRSIQRGRQMRSRLNSQVSMWISHAGYCLSLMPVQADGRNGEVRLAGEISVRQQHEIELKFNYAPEIYSTTFFQIFG